VENVFIESFNGRLRDVCLNVGWFTSLDDARQKLAKFREHYNRTASAQCPRSARTRVSSGEGTYIAPNH
jgi:hypothetical protein